MCADSYSVSVRPSVIATARERTRSFCQMCRLQGTLKYAYTLDPKTTEWADYVVQAYIVSKPVRENEQLVRKHSATVVSAS